MELGKLLAEERELVLRSLALCGIKVVIPLSTAKGVFKLSEHELAEQDIKEIHLLDDSILGINEALERLGYVLKGKTEKWSVFVLKEEQLNEPGFEGSFKVGDVFIHNGSKYTGKKGFIFCVAEDVFCVSSILEDGRMVTFASKRTMLEDIIFLKHIPFDYSKYHEDYRVLQTAFNSGLLKNHFE